MSKSIFLSILLFSGFLAGQAQRDTLTDMRRFIRVCNVYKQLPVALEVSVERRANLMTGQSDSSQMTARFCLRSDGSYMEMGGMEQLVNDSLLLLVNKPSKRMILYSNHQPVADRFREYMGLQVADSSIRRMAMRYTASMVALTGDTSVLEIRNRALLPATSLSKDEVRIRFNPVADEPYEVVQLKRTLVNVPRETYEKARVAPEWAGKTVAAGDSLFFLVKEQTVFFRYRKIMHDPEQPLPYRVSDRIVAEVPGKYEPVRGYADYILSQIQK
jgi:hypothetical protein